MDQMQGPRMTATKVMYIFIFCCLVGSILNSTCMAERARENVEFLPASRKEKNLLRGKYGMKSTTLERGFLVLAVGHRQRRNSDPSSNITATLPQTERNTVVLPTLPQLTPEFIPPKPFEITCSDDVSCKGRCQLERANGTKDPDQDRCYCDPYCNSFKDCCADFDQFCKGVVPIKTLDEKWRCYDGIMMIDSCPQNFTSIDSIVKCQTNDTLSASNYADVTPVITTTGKTYKNQHCALCNGVRKHDMKSLSYSFKYCQLTPPQNYSAQHKIEFLIDYCKVVKLATVGDQQVRKCARPFETPYYCSSGDSEKIGCERGPYRIVYSKWSLRNYKNVHCARCNGDPDEYLICGRSAFNYFESRVVKPDITIHKIYETLNNETEESNLVVKSLTVTLDVSVREEYIIEMYTPVIECGDDQVYDIFLGTCRKVLQFPSKHFSPELNKYNVAMWIKTGRNNERTIQDYPNEKIFDSLSKFLGLKPQSFELVERKSAVNSSLVMLVANLYIEKNITKRTGLQLSTGTSIDMLLNFTRPFDFSIGFNNFTVIKATSRLLTCVNVQYFTPEDYVVVHGSSSIYINQTQELLTEKQYFANSTKKHNGHQIPVGPIAVCRQYLLSTFTCNGTYISLDKDEYVMLPNNSVYRNASNTVYNQGEYSIINGSVVVCTKYSKKYIKTQSTDETDESQNDTALRILTSIGLSLSVVCLVFVLVTYLLFGELRTLPGINLMNLSSALLVAHFVWLIGSGQTGSHGACVAIAVILHFSFVASFAWMTVISFSTWKAFSSTGCAGRSSDKEYRRKKICHSLAVGWLPVLVLVLVCLILDQSGAVEIRYGGPKGCWINNGLANLFIFILPLAASIIWNVVFFSLTVKAIYKAKKQARMVTHQRENQRHFVIYIKIAVLMGFTWIFGFLALLKSAYFNYPFVVFNTLQGVYIAVAFTFNSRVKKLYQLKFFKRSNNLKESDRSTNNYTKHSTATTQV